MHITIDHSRCIGCGLCVHMCPDVFRFDGTVAVTTGVVPEQLVRFCEHLTGQCPVEALVCTPDSGQPAVLRILIVDDNDLARESLVLALQEYGYSCDSAIDGARALACIRTKTYEVIIMDVNLPGKSGLDVVRELRTYAGYATTVPVVGISGLPDDEACRSAGITAVLAKPIDMDELCETVKRLAQR